MIVHVPENPYSPQCLQFDDKGREKMIKVFERALNTYSPPDRELLDVLDSLKEK